MVSSEENDDRPAPHRRAPPAHGHGVSWGVDVAKSWRLPNVEHAGAVGAASEPGAVTSSHRVVGQSHSRCHLVWTDSKPPRCRGYTVRTRRGMGRAMTGMEAILLRSAVLATAL